MIYMALVSETEGMQSLHVSSRFLLFLLITWHLTIVLGCGRYVIRFRVVNNRRNIYYQSPYLQLQLQLTYGTPKTGRNSVNKLTERVSTETPWEKTKHILATYLDNQTIAKEKNTSIQQGSKTAFAKKSLRLASTQIPRFQRNSSSSIFVFIAIISLLLFFAFIEKFLPTQLSPSCFNFLACCKQKSDDSNLKTTEKNRMKAQTCRWLFYSSHMASTLINSQEITANDNKNKK